MVLLKTNVFVFVFVFVFGMEPKLLQWCNFIVLKNLLLT